jgi:hypothetical protein
VYRVYRYADFSLTLGCSDHDISAIVRHMKAMHQHGYTHEERINFRPTIWKDLLETSRSIVQVLRALHVEPATHSSEVRLCLAASGLFWYIMKALTGTLGVHCEPSACRRRC